jgi:ribonuclease D
MFERQITREAVNELPLWRYEGEVELISTEAELATVLPELNRQELIGFDTESRPAFRKGQYFPVALLQLATPERVYLIRLNKLGFPPGLQKIFSNPAITKCGIAIRDDIKELQRLAGFLPKNVVDLNDVAQELGIRNIGVRNLTAIFLEVRVSKSQQTSNWEREDLSEAQIAYAATDAWVCQEIYSILQRQGYLEQLNPTFRS